MLYAISDFDDAYSNVNHIPGASDYPPRWTEAAARFRDALGDRLKADIAYGERPCNKLDLFLPEGKPQGLVVFIHGGYWLRFGKEMWSHLAAGPLAHGWAVAMPSYTLCPENTISGITGEMVAATEKAASLVDGPIVLTGHSAGGHLAARMICTDVPLPQAVRQRIRRVVSLSGVNDLRPLLRTAMNANLKLTEAEAKAESPALLVPHAGVDVICWVGAGERAEFIRHNGLLANIWRGLGVATDCVEEPDRHHFNVIDGLAVKDSALMQALIAR